jgi:sterol O-acyltransferase
MSHALRGLSTRPPINREDSWNPNTSSDALDVDGVVRSKKHDEEHVTEPRSRSTTAIPSDDSGSETHLNEKRGNRRKSIEVVLEHSGKKGEYKFTAKDPVFQEALQTGLRQEAEKLNRKAKGRPTDLIYTQQYTTFDRQNATAAHSPFHGFFSLFWIAMALLLVRIAAGNYRTKGSVFGDAEILHLMVDKDLFVMLATDVAMCLATSFGFFLQKAIAKDYLTWNGSGWVIQSLWQTFFTCTIIWVTFWRDWPWTHTVFIVLHVFVLLMKQHAYAFYNGYCMLHICTINNFS